MWIISLDSSVKRSEELKRADVVMLTYACDQPITLDRISSYWLPELRRLEVRLCELILSVFLLRLILSL